MRDLMAAADTWPPGLALALFFYLPGLVVLHLLGLAADLLLYAEYRVTTYLRVDRNETAPPALCDAADFAATVRPALSLGSILLVGLAVMIALVSVVAHHAPANEFLQSCQRLMDDWWRSVASRAGV